MRQTSFSVLLSVFLGLFLLACSKYSEQVISEYDSHHYDKLYKTLHDAKGEKDNDKLLWEMQAGYLTFSYFAPHFSYDDLDKAEVAFKVSESAGIMSNVGANIGAALTNDLAIPYRGYIFEGVMLNLYKALALSSVGDTQTAFEFNRADDRQRRAKEYYAKEINKAREEATKQDSGEKKNEFVEKNIGADKIDSILGEKYSNLNNYAIYDNLIHPAVPYIFGVYLLTEGKDYAKAQDLLKEAYGISKAEIIADDMKLIDTRKSSQEYDKYTWIIIEDGNLARKSGLELSIPLVLPSGLNAVNFALPTLEEGKKQYSVYKANDAQADMIGNTSQLFASEFKKHLPSIITRAIISTVLKTAGTEAANQAGGYGQIAGAAMSLAFSAMNKADTRSSIILGDSFSVVKIPNTQNDVQISGDGTSLLTLKIDNTCNSLAERQKEYEDFSNILKEEEAKVAKDSKDSKDSKKSTDISARMKVLKNHKAQDTLCAKTDNIVYMRVRDNNVTHFIVKGE